MLANGSMKPAKLSEHLQTVHPGNISDSIDDFRTKKARFEKSGTLPKLGFTPTQKPCLEASYKVAYRIAQQKKPHTIAETLIKPCALDIVELVCGKDHRKKVEAVPLSNDVIHSRIVEMSSNVLKQVIEELNASPFHSVCNWMKARMYHNVANSWCLSVTNNMRRVVLKKSFYFATHFWGLQRLQMCLK